MARDLAPAPPGVQRGADPWADDGADKQSIARAIKALAAAARRVP